MRYKIVNETNHRIRFRLYTGTLTEEQGDVLEYALSALQQVDRVTIYRATAGFALEYHGDRAVILRKLDAFRFENVTMLAKTEHPVISLEEVRDRKLDPALKRRLRARVLVESVADMVLPMPVQLGYHAYQMITLKDI